MSKNTSGNPSDREIEQHFLDILSCHLGDSLEGGALRPEVRTALDVLRHRLERVLYRGISRKVWREWLKTYGTNGVGRITTPDSLVLTPDGMMPLSRCTARYDQRHGRPRSNNHNEGPQVTTLFDAFARLKR